MPVNLLVRDVPDDARDALAARARSRGQSLQAYLHELVTTAARRSENLVLLESVRALGGGSSSGPAETTAELAHLRKDRESQLVDRAPR